MVDDKSRWELAHKRLLAASSNKSEATKLSKGFLRFLLKKTNTENDENSIKYIEMDKIKHAKKMLVEFIKIIRSAWGKVHPGSEWSFQRYRGGHRTYKWDTSTPVYRHRKATIITKVANHWQEYLTEQEVEQYLTRYEQEENCRQCFHNYVKRHEMLRLHQLDLAVSEELLREINKIKNEY